MTAPGGHGYLLNRQTVPNDHNSYSVNNVTSKKNRPDSKSWMDAQVSGLRLPRTECRTQPDSRRRSGHHGGPLMVLVDHHDRKVTSAPVRDRQLGSLSQPPATVTCRHWP